MKDYPWLCCELEDSVFFTSKLVKSSESLVRKFWFRENETEINSSVPTEPGKKPEGSGLKLESKKDVHNPLKYRNVRLGGLKTQCIVPLNRNREILLLPVEGV